MSCLQSCESNNSIEVKFYTVPPVTQLFHCLISETFVTESSTGEPSNLSTSHLVLKGNSSIRILLLDMVFFCFVLSLLIRSLDSGSDTDGRKRDSCIVLALN